MTQNDFDNVDAVIIHTVTGGRANCSGAIWEMPEMSHGQAVKQCQACYLIMRHTDEAKIISSLHHVPTNPFEYAKQLRRLREVNNMTIEELAKRLEKSTEWVKIKLRILENDSN